MADQSNISENLILKGVVTEIADNGNYGKINCGRGQVFTFNSNQLDANYQPVLKDVVQFDLIEDAPFAIRLYHRDKTLQNCESAAVDLRINCPSCGEKILPKAKFVNGKLTGSFCPKCSQLISKADQPPKVSFWIWLVAILCALLVGTMLAVAFSA